MSLITTRIKCEQFGYMCFYYLFLQMAKRKMKTHSFTVSKKNPVSLH